MDINTLEIDPQDGMLSFSLEKGGYCIDSDRLTISVQTEAFDKDQFPQCALFCLEGHEVSGERAGDVFEAERTIDDYFGDHSKLPMAHAYFTFHAEEVRIKFTIDKVTKNGIVFSLEATHDDVDAYDENAKITPTKGRFALKKMAKEELWVPV